MSRHKIIDDAEDILNSGIKKSEREIFLEIQKLLKKFNTSGGKLTFDSETINLINEAEKRILKALNQSGYNDRVKSYLKDFDLIKENVIAEQKKINGINVTVRPINSLQKSAIQQTTNMLTGNGLNYNMIQPVKDVLLNAAGSGTTIAQAESLLRAIILGDSERLGKLERYVTQIARDSISQYDGMLQSKIAQEYELDGVSYEGSLIKDSRPQCVRWVAMGEIPIKDLPKEIKWAENNGSGLIPGTNKENFFAYRGGYNCRHFATAIRLSPTGGKKPIERNVDDLMSKAKKAEPELNQIMQDIADENNFGRTDVNLKSKDSILRKTNDELNGDVFAVKDSVRGTLFTEDKSSLTEAAKQLEKLADKFKHQKTELGYTGYLANIKMSNGIYGEVQMNTAKMIYAKEVNAKSILGESLFNKIKNETGQEFGLGHKYYEEWRVLIKSSKAEDLLKAKEIAEQSRRYYAKFAD